MAWKSLFQHLEGHLWMIIVNLYIHEIQIEEWWLYWSPNYVYITMGIVAPIGAMTILSINSTNGSRNVSDNGTNRSGGTTRGGGAWASSNIQDPLPTFIPIVELFCELWQNYQGVKIEKLQNLHNF
jgi:hypothetical protein